MTIKEKSRYKVSGRVVIRRIGEDTLLVPVSGSSAGMQVYPLNETAELIWQCLSAGGTVNDAVNLLSEQYEVEPADSRPDVEACLQLLLDESLIERIV